MRPSGRRRREPAPRRLRAETSEPARPDDRAQYNFTDPESRIMHGPDGFVQAYNAQVAVTAAQVIVGHGVTQDANDKRQLLPMITAVTAQAGAAPTEVLADAGYCSDENWRRSNRWANLAARIWTATSPPVASALTEGVVLHPTSGSHHAKRDHGAAFCTFAYVVGASLARLDEGRVERVLMLDLDAHYGDGHHTLTEHDPRFVHFDIAAAGRPQVRHEARGVWVETPSAAHYLDALCDEPPALLDRTQPSLVQALLGVDCHEDDDVGGIRGMTAPRLRDRDRFLLGELAARRLPVVISLAGGYSPECVELSSPDRARGGCGARGG